MPAIRLEPGIASVCRLPEIPNISNLAEIRIDDKGWYCLEVVVPMDDLEVDKKYWVEDANAFDNLHVMEMKLKRGDCEDAGKALMQFYAKAEAGEIVYLQPHQAICQIRERTPDDDMVMEGLNATKYIAKVQNSYKTRARTDEQAKHFDALTEEIADRRAFARCRCCCLSSSSYKYCT